MTKIAIPGIGFFVVIMDLTFCDTLIIRRKIKFISTNCAVVIG